MEERRTSGTYAFLDEQESYSHLGVGNRDKIPQIVPSMITNLIYGIFLAGIFLDWTEQMIRLMPYILAATGLGIYAFWTFTKRRWEERVIHRAGIWWNPEPGDSQAFRSQIILGDFLVGDEATLEAEKLRGLAEAYRAEGHIALGRAQRMQHMQRTQKGGVA